MLVTEWQAAARNVLDYCRDPRHGLDIGRKLGPVLLQDDYPSTADGWTLADDWALASALKDLIQAQIVHFRSLVNCQAPVLDSAIEHQRMLRHDITRGRADLKFWSLLWAYYICAMPHDEIAYTCDWSIRTSQLRLKEAREVYLLQKFADLECLRRQDRTGQRNRGAR